MTNTDPTPPDPASAECEDSADVSPKKPRRKWPWFCLAAALIAGFTYDRWLPVAAEALLPSAASSFGYRLRVDDVEQFDLTGVRVRGVRLENESAAGPLRRVRAEHLSVAFGWRLLRGELDQLASISADGIRIDIESASEEPPPEETTPPKDFLAAFARLPQLNINDLVIRIETPEGATQHTIQHLGVDELGAIELAGQTSDRLVAATAHWKLGNLADLSLDVDGDRLVQRTAIDLSKAYLGEVAIDASIPIGLGDQGVSARVDADGIQWQADWNGLDLSELWARIPADFELDLQGMLNVTSRGELTWARPTEAQVFLNLRGESLRYRGLEVPMVTGELTLENSEVRIPRLDIRMTSGNYALIEDAVFPLSDLDPAQWLSTAQAKLAIVIEDSKPLLQAFGSEEAKARELVHHRIALDATLDGRSLDVQELGLTSDAGNIRLSSGRVELTTENKIEMAAAGQARLHDLAAIGQLFGRNDWAGSLGGQLRVEGTYPRMGGELELTGVDVLIEGFALGELELQLRTDEPGADIEVARLHVASPEGEVTGQLWVTPGAEPSVRIEALSLERQGEQLTLQAPAVIRFGEAEGSCEPLLFSGTAGTVECVGNWKGSDFDLRLDVRELNPNLLNTLETDAPLDLAGAELRLAVLSRSGKLEFQTEGSINAWVPPHWPEPIDMRWNLSHKNGHLSVRAFEAHQAGLTLIGLHGECPIEFGEQVVFGEGPLNVSVETHMPLGLLQDQAIGTLNLGGRLEGNWRALTGSVDVVGRDLRLAPQWHPADLASGNIQGQIQLTDHLAVENASLQFGEWIDATVNLRGNLPLSVPEWIDSFDAALAASDLESRLEISALDVERLRPLLTGMSESFEVLREGKLSGNLQVTGALGAPEFKGSVTLVDGRVRPGGGLPPVEAMEAQLQFEQGRVLVRELRGTLGAAPFLIDGEVTLADGSTQMNLKLEGNDLLLLRNPDARVRANTRLRVHGPLEELKIDGKLELTTGSYSPQLDFLNLRGGPQGSSAQGFQLFTFREPPLRDMAFDIELTALEAFTIHNSILNGSIRPVLHLGGNGLLPVLNGTVYMEPTRLKLPVAQLDIIGGTLRFLEQNPFVPQLDIQGQTRQLGYEIRADISGAYDDPELLLSSTPPLSQEDLFLLLITGRLPEDPNRSNLLSTANTVALYLARDAVARWFADDGPLDEDSLVERLEFSIGQDVSKNGSETFEVAVRVTDRMGKPQATKNARHAYLVAERDKYEDYNYGLRWVFRFRK